MTHIQSELHSSKICATACNKSKVIFHAYTIYVVYGMIIGHPAVFFSLIDTPCEADPMFFEYLLTQFTPCTIIHVLHLPHIVFTVITTSQLVNSVCHMWDVVFTFSTLGSEVISTSSVSSNTSHSLANWCTCISIRHSWEVGSRVHNMWQMQHNSPYFQHGTLWQPDLCTNCSCTDGQTRCLVHQCTNRIHQCPKVSEFWNTWNMDVSIPLLWLKLNMTLTCLMINLHTCTSWHV